MKIGVLALQGAFIEHIKMLQALGVETFEIRQKADLKQNFDGIILPGGESTAQGKLLKELDMLELLRKKIKNGLYVLATCAGAILLAEKIEEQKHSYLATLPVTIKRNAYGRQLASFETTSEFKHVGTISMPFIRAPYFSSVGKKVEILATVEEKIVAVRYENQIAMSFHPEVTSDSSVHRFFINEIQKKKEKSKD